MLFKFNPLFFKRCSKHETLLILIFRIIGAWIERIREREREREREKEKERKRERERKREKVVCVIVGETGRSFCFVIIENVKPYSISSKPPSRAAEVQWQI